LLGFYVFLNLRARQFNSPPAKGDCIDEMRPAAQRGTRLNFTRRRPERILRNEGLPHEKSCICCAAFGALTLLSTPVYAPGPHLGDFRGGGESLERLLEQVHKHKK
jgi:hypothetical protein